jgi:hypothetical protein
MNLLDAPLISETRRNHALEHATLNLLSGRFPDRPLAGHSNPTGFFLIGEVPTEYVRDAVTEALVRLQNGESYLAIHQGCGTNYIASGILAGVFAFLGMSGTRNNRERLERLPLVILLSSLAFMIGQPLGPALQNGITTQPEPGDLSIVEVYPVSNKVHRIVTKA